MDEIWKDVSGYEGLYKVSNQGRIKSLKRPHNFKNIEFKEEQFLKPFCDTSGYYMVKLYNITPAYVGAMKSGKLRRGE